tara:strand:- start:490 stop:765 length:276 start_codon:yes stop_codon:yes gene_type:complete
MRLLITKYNVDMVAIERIKATPEILERIAAESRVAHLSTARIACDLMAGIMIDACGAYYALTPLPPRDEPRYDGDFLADLDAIDKHLTAKG